MTQLEAPTFGAALKETESTMRNRWFLLAAAAGAMIVTAAPVLAQKPQKDVAGKHAQAKEHKMFDRLSKKLNLTADQQDKIKGIVKEQIAALKPLHDDANFTR